MSELLRDGFPAVQRYPGPQAASDEDVRARAQELAIGLTAAVLRRDVGAFDAFISELGSLNEFGQGLSMAIDQLADIANDGLVGKVALGQPIMVDPAILQDKGVLERLQLWENCAPDDSPELDRPQRWHEALEIVSLALTGKAARLPVPHATALRKFGAATALQQRDVLLLLAVVVAQRFDKFAGWQGQGFDCLDNYRRLHPEQPGTQPRASS